MAQIVILAEDDVIRGVRRVAGEYVTVPDGYSNTRRVVKNLADVWHRNEADFVEAGLKKLARILQEDYPKFWTQFNDDRNADLRQKITQRLRDEPKYLQRAINEPGWFVETVTEMVRDVKAENRR